jgi:hypothetical protein
MTETRSQSGFPCFARPLGSQEEHSSQRDRRRRVAEVVDQVGEQRDAPGEDEGQRLRQCRGTASETPDGRQAIARALDGVVGQPVGMWVSRVCAVGVRVASTIMTVAAGVGVGVDPQAVTVKIASEFARLSSCIAPGAASS